MKRMNRPALTLFASLFFLSGCSALNFGNIDGPSRDFSLRLKAVPGAETSFPSNFLWGVATAGYQYEGGDTTSNWAVWEKEKKTAQPIGLADDSWRRYEEDLDLARNLGLNSYRLSIEWAKIEPRRGLIDQDAVKHYHDLLAAVHARGMEPVVTLLHFTYPAWLDSPLSGGTGGWESDETVSEFRRYAAWASKEYGAQIRYWLTINEPNTVGPCGYLLGVHPPGKHNPLAFASAMDHMARAHAAAYDAIHASDPDSMVSINPFVYHLRQGGSQYQTDSIDEKSDQDFLDRLTPHRNDLLDSSKQTSKRTLDFVAFDYYYSCSVLDLYKVASWWKWPIYPEGLYEVSKKYYDRYRLPLMVAENGFATEADNPRGDGWNREAFLVNHLAQLKRAMQEGVPVLGYMHWSLLDNYEWGTYDPKFGLYGVDRSTLRRFKTPGATVYEAIAKANRLPGDLLSRYLGKKN
ncbi:MAG TPA: hypothetical protein DD435_06820 [Cyanobacteria bacterium UBA8530]|nr:hypothetical protein [Cyanobacteria bacterium UBA8530]